MLRFSIEMIIFGILLATIFALVPIMFGFAILEVIYEQIPC